MTDKKAVAEWLLAHILDLVRSGHAAYQSDVVYDLEREWRGDWVYENDNGNLSIDRGVLAAFRKLDDWSLLEWDRGERSWELHHAAASGPDVG